MSQAEDYPPIEGVHIAGGVTFRRALLEMPRQPCQHCGGPNKSTCASCGGSGYCSKECQVRDWHQHKLACKGIITSIRLEETVIRLCQSPVILHLLRVAIALEHNFTTISPISLQDKDHECYLVFVHLHVHPASQEDFRALSSGTRTVQTKGPHSQIPGFVVLQIGSDVRRSMTVPITVKPIPLGEYQFEFDGWERLMNTKDKEAYERRRMRYAKLYKQARDDMEKRGLQTPNPIVMVQFEYDESTYDIGLDITADALGSARACKLPVEYENVLNECGVSVPQSDAWTVRDIESMINIYISEDNANALKLHRPVKKSDGEFLQNFGDFMNSLKIEKAMDEDRVTVDMA